MLPSSFTSPSVCRASDADVETVVVTDVAVVSDAVLSVCSVDDDDELDRVYEYYQQITEAEEEKE